MRGFSPGTDSAIRHLIYVAIQTASYTTTVAICGAFMAVVFPSTAVDKVTILFAFVYPIPALYCLSLLVTLGSKTQAANKQMTAMSSASHAIGARTSGILVQKDTVVAFDVDLPSEHARKPES